MTQYNTTLRVDAIPAELRDLDRSARRVGVRDATPKKKPSKVPFDPRTGKKASSTDPDTWASFDLAERALGEGSVYAGLMFALHPDDGFVFIDLNDCRNVKNKTPNSLAQA